MPFFYRFWPLPPPKVTAVARWKCDDSNEMQDWVLWHLGPSQPNRLNRLQSPRYPEIPSGKRLQNYGKSPCLMGNSTINDYKWPFSIAVAMLVYQRVPIFWGAINLVTATNYRKMIPTREGDSHVSSLSAHCIWGVGSDLINVMIDNVFPYDNYNN